MTRKANEVSLEIINKLFYIEDGTLRRKKVTSNRVKLNEEAGSYKNNGYRRVSVNNVAFLVHRIMYQIYNSIDVLDGNIMIDHIDGNIHNNSKDNLRTVDNYTNVYNTKGYSTSKYKGVSIRTHTKKYMSRIMVNRKEIFLGYYDSVIEAAKVYDINAIKYQGDYARLNFPRTNYKI